MIFTNLTRKALEIATKTHEGQVDKAGVTYILHPVHLAEQMDTPIETAVALLHDVVEDSDYTLKDLIDADFPYQVIEAVDLLTHKDGVPYMEYIAKIKGSGNPVARKVKLQLQFANATGQTDPNVFTIAQADLASKFLKRSDANNELYICSDNGVSRSAAIAAAVFRSIGKNDYVIWRDPRYLPNPYIFRLMCVALHADIPEDAL